MFSGVSGNNGISNFNFYNTVSSMNTLKFQQAMLSNQGSISSIPAMGKTLDSSASSFLKDYQSAMTDLKSAANALRDTSSGSKSMGVSSSSNKVADVEAKFALSGKAEFDIEVKQLATSQANRSTGVASTGRASSGGTLTLTNADGKTSVFVADPMAKNNREQLTMLAKQINNRNTGYTAKVIEENGKSSLEIVGTKTGEASAFTVSGDFAQRAGLSTPTRQAQDALYSVDKGDDKGPQEFSSASNTVTVGDYRIEATLKQTGSTTIKIGPDQKTNAQSVQKMVTTFNKTLSLLNANSSRGVGVLAQMRRMVVPPASEKSMEQIGLSVKNDGTLSFDADTFAAAMEKQPKLTSQIVENVAQGIYQDASQGMNTSSANLLGFNTTSSAGGLNSSSAMANYQMQSQQDPMNMLSSYAKSGAYNLSNYYAVGSLMNFSI